MPSARHPAARLRNRHVRLPSVHRAGIIAVCSGLCLQGSIAFADDDGFQDPPEILDGLKQMFEGTAANSKHFCAIMVTQNGRLRPNIENTELSSRQAGGIAGVATVTSTNSSYQMSIDQTIGFTSAPADGNTNTTFSATYSGSGAANFMETPGNIPVKAQKGTTTVETNFIATRSPDAFPAGNYNGELILRCE